LKHNRIAIKLMEPESDENKSRFYDCARRLKLTLEREMKFVSTVGEDAPRKVGQVASLTEIDDVMPCKALIKLAAEQAKVGDKILVMVNPSPRLNFL